MSETLIFKNESPTVIELQKPWCGWSDLTLTDSKGDSFTGRLSYIDAVPWEFLRAFEIFLKNGCQTAITFDDEGTEWTIVFDVSFTRIMWERNSCGAECFFISFEEIARTICNSLLENIDDWVRFSYFDEEDEKEFSKDKKEMENKISCILSSLSKSIWVTEDE